MGAEALRELATPPIVRNAFDLGWVAGNKCIRLWDLGRHHGAHCHKYSVADAAAGNKATGRADIAVRAHDHPSVDRTCSVREKLRSKAGHPATCAKLEPAGCIEVVPRGD